MNEEPRVIITNPMCGLIYMQVCAVKDTTDEEILDVCNRDNPAGTTNGWGIVCRSGNPEGVGKQTECEKDKNRLHILVAC